jgi:hypothetical protein
MKRWMQLDWRYAAVAAATLALSGCAGGFKRDFNQTKISTDPVGATCHLAGTGFAKTVKTPIEIILPKKAAPINIRCRAAGHRPFEVKVKAVFNEKILNNFLMVSSMGLLIDMMNGHDTKMPDRVHMNMEPTSFVSAKARDVWFLRYRNHITRKWDYAVRELSDRCNDSSGEEGACMLEIKAAEASKGRALAVLEQQRRRAHIRTRATARRPAKKPVKPPAIQ